MKNKYKICGDYTILYVVRKGITHEALIDTEDLPLVQQSGSWCIQYIQGKGTLYVKNSKQQYLHRLIMGFPTTGVVDHKHHNTLDNRKSQLRVISRADNVRFMQGAHRDSKYSGVRNVTWNKERGKWYIRVQYKGKQKSFGYTEDLLEAAMIATWARNTLYDRPFTRAPIKLSH